MTDHARRDAFGRMAADLAALQAEAGDPARLDLPARVDVLRRLSGQLQAHAQPEARWLGRSLGRWLTEGGDLARVLGVLPQQGSRRTPQALVLAERRAHALLALAEALGSDSKAAQVLQGRVPCPERLAHLLCDAQSLGCPRSRAAVHRARAASPHNA